LSKVANKNPRKAPPEKTRHPLGNPPWNCEVADDMGPNETNRHYGVHQISMDDENNLHIVIPDEELIVYNKTGWSRFSLTKSEIVKPTPDPEIITP
jgi:hypothetical protein